MSRLFSILILVFLISNGYPSSSIFKLINCDSLAEESNEFSVEEMQADFLQARQILEDHHCCIYEYTSKTRFDSLFDNQYALIDRPMKAYEFFRILSPITANLGCGHTSFWMPSEYWRQGPDKLFPLELKLIEGRVVVAGNYTDTIQLPRGSILHEINGRNIGDIIAEMKANYPADAFNVNFKTAQVERRFSLIYARRFGFFDSYEVVYSLPRSDSRERKILKPANDQAVRDVVFKNFRDPELKFEIIEEENAAILTINTFIYYDRVVFFTSFLDSCFSLIENKNIQNLVLDLRGNDGGDPFCAAPLFSYLEPEALPYFAEPYGKYSDLADPIPLAENHFSGKLYVLMDGRCFSTNGHFCSLLKYHQCGTLIGTESGAGYCCNAGRNGQEVLDNTKIQLYFARSSFCAAVEEADKSKPIQPDYPINPTYSDFLEDRDVFMEKAFELISEN